MKILFLSGVHGNEVFTIKILKELERELPGKFSYLLANELAVKKATRFIDTDLNRAAPGDPNSKDYERRRAAEILEIAKKYKYVIDLHGTSAKSGIFLIITNPKRVNMKLAALLPVKNVVVWESAGKKSTGPLTRFTKCGLEIECGPKEDRKVKGELYRILKTIIKTGLDDKSGTRPLINYFRVYGKILKKDLDSKRASKLSDFRRVAINGEVFYPLLVNCYNDIFCYKMRKIPIPVS